MFILDQINNKQYEFWDKWKNQEWQFAEDKQFGYALDTIFWVGLQREHFRVIIFSQLQYAY
jgi:hypothetical protein